MNIYIYIYVHIPRPSKTCRLIDYYCRKHRCFHRDFKTIYSNVTVGLMNPPPGLNNLDCPPQKKCNLKTGGPPGLNKIFCLDPSNRPPVLISNSLFQKILCPILFLSHHVSSISEPWDFSNHMSSNPMESLRYPWDSSNQSSSNPMESAGILTF